MAENDTNFLLNIIIKSEKINLITCNYLLSHTKKKRVTAPQSNKYKNEK